MKFLVTGGGGFLGEAVVRQLLAQGHQVVSISRQHYSNLETMGVEQVLGSIAEAKLVERAAKGCDAVFHVAAKAGMWGKYDEYYQTNVVGTQNVIAACRTHKIRKLIYTSTPSVVHAGGSIQGGDESLPYAKSFLAHYPRTKVMAEKDVLKANDGTLATVALRPHLIWGPGDNHLAPRMIARQKAGRLRLIGSGNNLVDSVYVDNAAQAHIRAFEKLDIQSACSGKAYFISQGEPLTVKTLMNGILASAGEGPVEKSVPAKVAYALGAMCEMTYGLLGVKKEPLMTRFLAKQLATEHWFDISAAQKELGYRPTVSVEEGLNRLKTYYAGQDNV